MLRANTTTPPVFVPYAPGTCASPLDDTEQLEYLTAPDVRAFTPSTDWRYYRPSTNMASGGDVGAEFEWAGGWLSTVSAKSTKRRPPKAGFISTEWFRPHPCSVARGRPGLMCEEEVVRMLTLQRNQRLGAMIRHSGRFDVLALTRWTLGVALNSKPTVMAAVDSLSTYRSTNSVLMYAPRNGPRRPVRIEEAALLSLGRGVLADPAWLGSAFLGGFNTYVRLRHFRRGSGDAAATATWRLGASADTTNSSLWLQYLASVLCQPPSSSFVTNGSLCAGVERPPPAMSVASWSLRAGDQPVGSQLGLGAGGFAHMPRETVFWSMNRASSKPSQPLPACPSFRGVSWRSKLRHPIWLLGRRSREVHANGPGSQTEMDMAGRLSSCTFKKYKPSMVKRYWPPHVEDIVADLAGRYRRDLLQVDPPPEPVSNAELLLAVLVVVPEAATVLVLLIQRRRQPPRPRLWWRWQEGAMLTLAVATGAAALMAVGYVDWQERRGAAWRAASTRLELSLPASDIELARGLDATGRSVTLTESVFIVARAGYRPHLTRRLLVAMAATNLALVILVLLRVALAAVWSRGGDGDEEVDGLAEAEGVEWGNPAYGTPVQPSWRRHRLRRLRFLGLRSRRRSICTLGGAATVVAAVH